MGKAKKIKVSRSDGEKGQSLADQVISDSTVKQSGRVKVRKREEEPSKVSDNVIEIEDSPHYGSAIIAKFAKYVSPTRIS